MRPLALPLAAALLAAVPAPAQTNLAAEVAAKSRTGGTVAVTQGGSGLSLRFSVARGRTLVLRASTPVVWDGGGRTENALRVISGGRLVVEGPLTLTGYRVPVFVTTAEGFTARGLTIRKVGRTGILTGKTSNVLVEDCDVDASGAQEHAVYLSEGGTNLTIRRNRLIGGRGCAAQINSCPFRGRNLTVTDNRLGPAGNAAVNVSAVTGGTIARNIITGTRQDIALFSDGGRRRKCRVERIDLRGQVGRVNADRWTVGTLLPTGTRRRPAE